MKNKYCNCCELNKLNIDYTRSYFSCNNCFYDTKPVYNNAVDNYIQSIRKKYSDKTKEVKNDFRTIKNS